MPAESAGEQAGLSTAKELVRAFALQLGRFPETRQEWGAWTKAFAPLAEQGVQPEQMAEACKSYLGYHHKLGRTVDLTPFGLTKHWQVISQALEQRHFSWMRWASDVSWRLPLEEVHWLLEQAASRISGDQAVELAAMVERARAAHAEPADDLLRWVDEKGWSLDDDDWRLALVDRLPRTGSTELRRAATHRRHEMRRDLARLRAGLALPKDVAA